MTDNHIIKAPEVAIETGKMHPLVTAAMQGGKLDTQTLREIMELQRDWEKGEAQKSFTRAMVDLKAELPSVLERDKNVSFGQGKTSYMFTSLAHAMSTVSPHLTQFGFALSWTPLTKENSVSVTCRLTHTDGHYEETTLTAPPDKSGSKNSVQAIGSTISYLQRYTALSLLGIATADMKCTDELQSDNYIDPDRNLKAVAYLTSVGVTVTEAEEFVGASVREWTADDLHKLREKWLKRTPEPTQPTQEPVELIPTTQLSEKKAALVEAARAFYGEDDHMVQISRKCRQRGTDFNSATDNQCESMIQEINAEADREARQ